MDLRYLASAEAGWKAVETQHLQLPRSEMILRFCDDAGIAGDAEVIILGAATLVMCQKIPRGCESIVGRRPDTRGCVSGLAYAIYFLIYRILFEAG